MSKNQQRQAPRLPGKGAHVPDDPRLVQGRNAFARADYEHAIHLWQRLIDAQTLPPEKHNQVQRALAEAHFRLGQRLLFEDHEEATRHLVRSAELQPDDALYAYHAGLAYHRLGNLEAASGWYMQALHQALPGDPAATRAQQMLILAQKPAHAWSGTETRDALIPVQRVFGTSGAQSMADALQAYADGNWEKAASALRAVPVEHLPLLAQGLLFYYQGLVAYRLGDPDHAYHFWTKAFDAGLKTPAFVENLTNSILLKLDTELAANKLDLARTLVQRGLAISPENKRLQEIDAALELQQGYLALESGDWEAVLAAWSDNTGLSSQNARVALMNVAIANEKLERWVDAAEAWREFARRRPRQESAEGRLTPEQVARLWERISGLYMQAGDPDEAIKTLQTALKYEPDNPKLMLALARCNLDTDRTEAAQNQLDKVLAQNPNDVEALVLRAEATEIDPRRSFRQRELDSDLFSLPPGIPEWEAVLAQNDETYKALAQERLTELYDHAFNQQMFWFPTLDSIKKLGERALKYLPQNHFLRALYAQALLRLTPQGRTEAKRQIELIDLTEWDALHQLIDGFQMVDDQKGAASLLQRAEALKPLDAEFYAEIGRCALHRKQEAVAEKYFAEAVKRSVAENERLAIPTLIGTSYLEAGEYDKAEATLVKALTAEPKNGPANFLMALLADRRHDRIGAKKYLREAERGAERIDDPTFLETVRAARQIFNVPTLSLWDIFSHGPSFSDGGPFDSDLFDGDMNDAGFPPIRTRRRS